MGRERERGQLFRYEKQGGGEKQKREELVTKRTGKVIDKITAKPIATLLSFLCCFRVLLCNYSRGSEMIG